ncbi:prophage regulatory protein [Pseudomonas nitritireducens]|uniref:Prophage regulatory protein n=1 Tax=Pseudomonas nitroreducens TaxID=46680 RepID=A0A7W7KID9_PSENT|nr:AlpA family transcriptional regulator [Pseudomonas nitritireducens]MBB4863309.1 prophage regulatory protein [Pseudomonas nitritireducens]
MAAAEKIDRFMRLDEVLYTTGLGKNTLYRRIREGSFPKQVRIGPNSVAWRQSDVEGWMQKIAASNDESVH